MQRHETHRDWRWLFLVGLWLAVFAGSCLLDRSVAVWMRDSGVAAAVKGSWPAAIVKLPGTFWIMCVAAAGLCFLHPLRWRSAAFMLLAGLAGLVNSLIKWIAGRTRPFALPQYPGEAMPFALQPFRGGLGGLFDQKNLAFPSGHACMAFAAAAALAILLPRRRWLFYGVAAVVAAERVVENAHYLSDTVGAAAVGVLTVRLIWRICVRLAPTGAGEALRPGSTASAGEMR